MGPGQLTGTYMSRKQNRSNAKVTWRNSKMARCVSVFADNSLLALKYIMDYIIIHESFVLYCSYIITLFV